VSKGAEGNCQAKKPPQSHFKNKASLSFGPMAQQTVTLPNITAQSYAIYYMKAGNLIFGRKENLKREIASLTKIMTLYTALDLCDRFRLNPDKI